MHFVTALGLDFRCRWIVADNRVKTVFVLFMNSIRETPILAACLGAYFVAEADEPIDDWILTLKKIDIPVIIYGLTFAICHPGGKKRLFESVEDLEYLFRQLEEENLLSIETPDLWLPNELLDLASNPKRGDVYRIGQKLFTSALRFRTGRTSNVCGCF